MQRRLDLSRTHDVPLFDLPARASRCAACATVDACAELHATQSRDLERIAAQLASGWRWWDEDTLRRVIGDVAMGVARRLRPGLPLPSRELLASCRLDDAALGFDSLELLSITTGLCEFFRLPAGRGRRLRAATIGGWAEAIAASLPRGPGSLMFRTSGSTGEPKWVSHKIARLILEADYFAALLTPVRRVVTTISAHHIYGFLFTVLLPARLGLRKVLDVRDEPPGMLPAIVEPGDLVVGYPDVWTAASGAAAPWPAGVAGVTSTAPCPAETAAALECAGLCRLVQVHGSTETAGLGWRDDARSPYRLLPFWARVDAGWLCRHGETVALPDELAWQDPTHYRIGRRRDGAVQVGGTNVYPAKVRVLLATHPAVADAAVRPMTCGEGDRLKAFVVPTSPDTDLAALRLDLHGFVRRHLCDLEQPRSYSFGPKLPKDAMGKPADWPIERP